MLAPYAIVIKLLLRLKLLRVYSSFVLIQEYFTKTDTLRGNLNVFIGLYVFH